MGLIGRLRTETLFGMLTDGRSQTTGIRQRGKEATMLLILNSHPEPVEFTMP